jgi:hypothetical protein
MGSPFSTVSVCAEVVVRAFAPGTGVTMTTSVIVKLLPDPGYF